MVMRQVMLHFGEGVLDTFQIAYPDIQILQPSDLLLLYHSNHDNTSCNRSHYYRDNEQGEKKFITVGEKFNP